MYVVRFDDAGEPDFKAFTSLSGATSHFNKALMETYEGAYQDVALYEVPDETNAGAAVKAVRDADPSIVLLKLEESESVRMDRFIREVGPNLKIDL